MASEIPIACSLGAADLAGRLARMRAIGAAALLGVDRRPADATLRFRRSARADLEAIVAAEAECCPFLDMTLRDEAGAVALRIAAPPGAEAVLDDCVKALTAD
jgi:MerR family transcriptional regulator, copper efflux regulator